MVVGPCIAKKAEAREKDLVGAVDYVLTFQEVRDIFAAAGIDPAEKASISSAIVKSSCSVPGFHPSRASMLMNASGR